MATTLSSDAYSMLPSELVPVFKNHASMPLLGTGESLKEVVTNYKYPNPYECRVHSGNAPVDTSDDYYVPEIGLPGNCWWFIKYFPFDASGNGAQLAIPLDTSQTPRYRGSNTNGWDAWMTLGESGTKTTQFTINTSDWVEDATVTGYSYKATIADTNIIESMDANITISVGTMPVAQAAQLAPSGSTFNGGMNIYSKQVPSGPISGTYVLFNV